MAIWEMRVQPFLPELVGVLERDGELAVTGEVREQLCQMSAATIDRVLKAYRGRGLRRPFSTTGEHRRVLPEHLERRRRGLRVGGVPGVVGQGAG